jgi:ligand-binding sensor domain-containing protein/signal transduction histidine kinase
VDDGLPSNLVSHAFQDSQGYLWFATPDGLSRFDGYRFVNYGGDELGNRTVFQIRETRDRTLWIGTNRGLVRFNETPGRGTFTTFPIGKQKAVRAFGIGPGDKLWCLQDDGPYVGGAVRDGEPRLERLQEIPWTGPVWPRSFHDRSATLWFSHRATLFRAGAGDLTEYRDPATGEVITAIGEHRDGTLLVARSDALQAFHHAERRWTTLARGLPEVTAIATDSRGRLWIGTVAGLFEFDSTRGRAARVRSVPHHVLHIAEDREGSLWITTAHKGIYKIGAELIVSYTTADGLADPRIAAVVEDPDRRIYAVTVSGGTYEILEDGVALVNGSRQAPFAGVGNRLVHDGAGRWWMWTDEGAFRIDGPLDFRRAVRVAAAGSPVGGSSGAPPVVDRRGAVWLAPPGPQRLLRTAAAPGGAPAWEPVPLDGSLRPVYRMAAAASGTLWIGTSAQLARLSPGGRIEVLPAAAGLPETRVNTLFVDSRGWLWVGLVFGGVSVTREPDAAQPTFTNYTERHGISSQYIPGICEDARGRMYFVTGRGLDRLDPHTGQIRHIRSSDGLAGTAISTCTRDSRGRMWVGTAEGLSRIDTDALERSRPPPAVLIASIRAGDREIALAPRGARDPLALTLEPSQRSVQIEFVGLSFVGERALRYQFRLDGGSDGWSVPSESRSVIYGNLAPGRYTFHVRALNPDGVAGPEASALALTIRPPVWRRWWFLALMSAAIAAAAFWVHRLRLNRVLAVERVRQQLSTDLHDEIGSGLVQIAAMGEMARDDPSRGVQLWPSVASVARSLRDSMSDIVWAVDPSHDHLADLVQRMKDVAYDALEADGIEVDFRSPDAAAINRVAMTANQRRHLLLILKEAVTNIVKHAGATAVVIEVALEPRRLRLVIGDDGSGFVTGARASGHGLPGMRRRARELGGTVEVQSTPGVGTTIAVSVPA